MTRDRLLVFFALNYFAQGMGGLAYEPIWYFQKDALGLGPAQAAAFTVWTTLPLTIKPLFGLLTDMLPWAGKRRAPHLVAVSLLTSAAWLALAALPSPGYGAALGLLLLVNIGFVLSDVVCDGVMVERGKERGLTGLYQSVQLAVLYSTLVVTGLGGGWLSQNAPYRWVFALTALFPLLTAYSARLVDEPGVGDLRETAARGLAGLKTMASDRRCWAVAGGIFLWSFTPFLGTAQFYYQSEALGLTPLFIGGLSTASGLAGVAGAALFGRLVGREGTARLVKAAVWAGAPLSLLYLLYMGPGSIMALTVLFSLTGVVFRLALMDLAAKSCPEGAEATGFAAYMAVFNFAASFSNGMGGALYEKLSEWNSPYQAMAFLSLTGTACALASWPLLKYALRDDAARA